MSEPLTCGLFVSEDITASTAVPLEGVRIDACLTGLSTEVTVAQRYRNREAVAVEAVYVFPLEEGSAVCGFEARIGDRRVRGRVEERERAFEIYDDAMADGHGAFLLDQERPNVFTASVGNLRPDEAVEIRITYVALARREGPATRFQIPTTVSPRYVPASGAPEVGEPEGDRVNPERRCEVPYGLELRVEIEADGPILTLESPSHPVRTTLAERGATVELARAEAALDRDFVLLIETAEPHRPVAHVACEDDGTRVCMLSFHPDLETEEVGGSEVLFLLDCSGSMIGDSIRQARRALALSVRALAEGDTFNVVRFGSRFKSLWRRPRAFDESTLAEATRYIEGTEADLGGTEILPPLRRLLELRRDRDRRRQILLLTDGEVSNEREVVALAGKHAANGRIFTFGIGAGASEYLVRELARVTRGAAEFIFPGERIEPKVLRMFGRVRSPALQDLRIDWGGLDVEQAPATVPPVFAGDSLTVFGRVATDRIATDRVRSGSAERVVLSAGEQTWEIAVDLDATAAGGPVPALWAREAIRELEEGMGPRRGSSQKRRQAEERRRRRLVELGQRYGLLSSATSYVAVEERPEGERVESAELRKIPIALTVGWGGYGTLVGGARRRLTGSGLPLPTQAPPAAAVGRMRPQAVACASAPAAAGGFIESATAAVGDLFGRWGAKKQSARRPPRPAAAFEEPLMAAEEPVADAPSDRLYDLLMTQNADGSFPLSPALEDWLGDALGAVRGAAGEHGEAWVVTAVVVAVLERDEPGRADEWRPAVTKARRWLRRQGATDFDAPALLAGPAVIPARA